MQLIKMILEETKLFFIIISFLLQPFVIPYCKGQLNLPQANVTSVFNTENGNFVTGKIYTIIPGAYGYLWVSAENGVFRYNGKTFQNTLINGADEVRDICIVKNDLLLVLLRNGKTKGIDIKTLKQINTDSLLRLDKLKADPKYYSAVFEKGDELLFVKKKYTDSVNKIHYVVLVSPQGARLAKNRTESIAWLSSFAFHSNKNVDAGKLFDNWVNTMSFLDIKNNLLFLGREMYDTLGRQIFNGRVLGDEKIISAVMLREKELWLGNLNGGLVRYKNFTDSGIHSLHSSMWDEALISSINEDGQKNVWINTFGNGLLRLKKGDIDVIRYNKDVSKLVSNDIFAFAKTGSGTVITYSATADVLEFFSANNHVSKPYLKGMQRLFTQGNNVFFLTKNGIEKISIQADGKPGTPVQIYSSNQNIAGSVWLDDCEWNEEHFCLMKDVVVVLSKETQPKTIELPPIKNIRCFQPLEGFSFLLGTNKGIYKDGKKLPWLKDESFHKICKSGNELICCTGSGVYSISLRDLEQNTAPEKLDQSYAFDVNEDEKYFYLKTIHGIKVIGKASRKIIAYHDFLNYTVPFSISDFHVTPDYIIVSGNAGLFYFPKQEFINYCKDIPAIYILNSLNQNIPADSSYSCNYKKNIEAAFTLEILDCNNEEKKISYRILKEGIVVMPWNEHSEATPVRIINPDPGSYIIQFKIKSEGGQWEKNVSYAFTVQLQWWQSLWAKVFLGFIILFLLGFLFTRYAKYKVKQSQQKYTMELRNKDLEAQALFSQLNSHFVFNALVPFQDLTIRGDKDGALSYINKFASLMRGMLNNSRMKNVSLKAEISFITHYLEVQQQRYGNFDFSIDIAEDINHALVTIPTLFVQPIVENAIEHGIKKLNHRGEINIDISLINNHALRIIISDNGKGFEKGIVVVEHHAIQIIQERLSLLEKMGQEAGLAFENNTNGGAKVVLTLPYTIHNS